MTYSKFISFICFFTFISCISTSNEPVTKSQPQNAPQKTTTSIEAPKPISQTFDFDHPTFYPKDREAILQRLKDKVAAKQDLVIHAFVPLCDNENQGIVPVSKALGDGQNPKTNLYWGAMYGIKNHFTKSSKWKCIAVQTNVEQPLLERVIFQRKTSNGTLVYLVADAYDGSKMRNCVVDYLQSLAGRMMDKIVIDGKKLQVYANADLLVFNGHDGLMDYNDIPYFLNTQEKEKNMKAKDAVMIACYSGNFFRPFLQKAGAYPLVVTNGLMAPEAYVLEAILEQWIQLKPAETIRKSAGMGYNQYQKCGTRGADRLFSTGW
ncbi:MAG: hypothetical protein ACPGVB_13575 [Chitinophagales bacterium]